MFPSSEFYSTDMFAWIIAPLLIVLARICDVTLGTIRIILVGKGYRNVAPFVGFFEILIWIIVVSQIMQYLDRWIYYVAYATGYAMGTFIGMKIENKLSLGQVVLRIITSTDSTSLTDNLKAHSYNFTTVDANGKFGPVKIIFMITQRYNVPEAIKMIEEYNPNSFFSIEDIRYVKGTLPGGRNPFFNSFNPFNKSIAFMSRRGK